MASAYMCPKCKVRPIGRFDRCCTACLAAQVFGMMPGSAPTRCFVLCDCLENSMPDPECKRCGGNGELEVPGF